MTQQENITAACVSLHYAMTQAEDFKREMRECGMYYQERRIDNIIKECNETLKKLTR